MNTTPPPGMEHAAAWADTLRRAAVRALPRRAALLRSAADRIDAALAAYVEQASQLRLVP